METVHRALKEFQEKCPSIGLDAEVKVTTKTGGSYTFRYATLGNIKEIIKPILAECGLAITQGATHEKFTTTILHESGEAITSELPFKGVWTNAQEAGSLFTYFRRYGLVTALGLVAEDDDDGNAASGNTVDKATGEITAKPTKKFADEKKPIKFTETALKEIGEQGVLPVKKGAKDGRNWYLYEFAGDKGFVNQEQHEYVQSFLPRKDIIDLPF